MKNQRLKEEGDHMKINLLFPGQGAQYADMGLDFYEKFETYRKIVDQTNEAMEENLLDVLKDSEKLKDTKNSQLAIFSMSYGISQLLKESEIKVDATVGLSLGEYSALAFGESFSLPKGLRLLKKRSELMQIAAQKHETFLLAISFLEREKVLQALEGEKEVYLANENAPNQNVIGGPKDRLDVVKEKMMEAGAKKVTELNVSAAFHTPFMEEAEMAFGEELKKETIEFPRLPVLSNFKGDFYHREDNLSKILAKHISHPVKLGEALQKLEAKDEDYHLIIGPGKAMASMLKQNKIPGHVIKIGTLEELSEAIHLLKEKTNE